MLKIPSQTQLLLWSTQQEPTAMGWMCPKLQMKLQCICYSTTERSHQARMFTGITLGTSIRVVIFWRTNCEKVGGLVQTSRRYTENRIWGEPLFILYVRGKRRCKQACLAWLLAYLEFCTLGWFNTTDRMCNWTGRKVHHVSFTNMIIVLQTFPSLLHSSIFSANTMAELCKRNQPVCLL